MTLVGALAAVTAAMCGEAIARQHDVVPQAGETVGYTPPAQPVTIAAIGDSYTGGSNMGGDGPFNWTAREQSALSTAKQPVRFSVTTGGGSGYIATGSSNRSFDQMIREGVGPSDDIVVVFGSRNDTAAPQQLVTAAQATFADVKRLAPAAQLLIIGPPWVNADPPPNIRTDRDVLAQAASAAQAVFVDPLAEGWFTGADSALIGADGVHPTDAGHAYMGRKIQVHLLPMVQRAASTP